MPYLGLSLPRYYFLNFLYIEDGYAADLLRELGG